MRKILCTVVVGVMALALSGCPSLPAPTPITVDSPLYGHWIVADSSTLPDSVADGTHTLNYIFATDGTLTVELTDVSNAVIETQDATFAFDETAGTLAIVFSGNVTNVVVAFTDPGMRWTSTSDTEYFTTLQRP